MKKECSRCGGPLGDYWGKHRYCRACKAVKNREYRQKLRRDAGRVKDE